MNRSPMPARRKPLPPGQLRGTSLRPVPLNPDGTVRYSSFQPRRQGLSRGRSLSVVPPVVTGARRKPQRRKDTIPPAVRKLVHARDERYCQHCGGHFPEGGIHQHHRRLKQAGGDPRPHTDCPCNLVSLCWVCHDYLHSNGDGRVKAEAEGFIIPNETAEPGKRPVLLHGEFEGGGGVLAWLLCEGRREYVEPGGAVA